MNNRRDFDDGFFRRWFSSAQVHGFFLGRSFLGFGMVCVIWRGGDVLLCRG